MNDEDAAAVHTSPAAQYYDLVKAALFSVERVTASRLRSVGTFDPAGVVAELTALNKEVENPPEPVVSAATKGAARDDESGGGGAEADSLETVRIEILKLKPKLERCVVRAKI